MDRVDPWVNPSNLLGPVHIASANHGHPKSYEIIELNEHCFLHVDRNLRPRIDLVVNGILDSQFLPCYCIEV